MVLTLSARSMTTPLASPTIRRHIFSTTSFTWCIYTYFCNICFYACFCPTTSVVFMPLPTTLCFLSVRPSVVPQVNTYFTSPSVSVLGGGISTKLAANIRRVNVHCWKCLQGQRWRVKVIFVQMC